MEQHQPKQYTDLMVNKKIIYVHGFMSSGATHTATILRSFLPHATILSPDLPIHPEEAMALLHHLQATENPDLIIGTSMGGMYTEMLYGTDRICINPAFHMGSTISESNMLGKQVYQNPRQDGVQEVIVTKALQKEYKAITEQCFANVDTDEQQRVYGLFGDNDPVVHTFDLFHQHYPQAIYFHGEHRLTEKVVYHYLLPYIRFIDDKQEQRTRKEIIIDWATLRDSYGNPKPSLHKAYEFLIENYNVKFLVPAPSNLPSFMQEAQKWIQDVFSAPAWNNIIFANGSHLLLADYLITTEAAPNFMGTDIRFGSGDFKTWENIITFFERLKGQ